MAYTLGQAAKATGKSKPAISQAIAEGRISATKDELGRWSIDPAELHRVYPPVAQEVNDTEHLPDIDERVEIARLTATVEGLERQLNERDRLCRQLESERDSLRNQNVRLTALLPPPAPPPSPAPAPKKRRGWKFWRRRLPSASQAVYETEHPA
jgi:hypothetical protein